MFRRRSVASGMRAWSLTLVMIAGVLESSAVAQWRWQTLEAQQFAKGAEQFRLDLAAADREQRALKQELIEARLQLPTTQPAALPANAPAKVAGASSVAVSHIHVRNSSGVVLRDAPGGHMIGILKGGTAVVLGTDEPVSASGMIWSSVRTIEGTKGWIVKAALSSESS